MTREKMLELYVGHFGKDAPIPPDPILKSLAEMIADNTLEDIFQKVAPAMDSIIEEIEEVSGEELSPDHPLFHLNLEEE